MRRRLVTRDVGALSDDEIAQALARGEAEAQRLLRANRIRAAALHLRGETRVRATSGVDLGALLNPVR